MSRSRKKRRGRRAGGRFTSEIPQAIRWNSSRRAAGACRLAGEAELPIAQETARPIQFPVLVGLCRPPVLDGPRLTSFLRHGPEGKGQISQREGRNGHRRQSNYARTGETESGRLIPAFLARHNSILRLYVTIENRIS